MLQFSQETFDLVREMRKFMAEQKELWKAGQLSRDEQARGNAGAKEKARRELGTGSGSLPSPTFLPNPPVWETLCANEHRLWCDVALFLLAFRPVEALEFLNATHREPYPPIHAVEDSILHLVKMHSSVEEEDYRGKLLRRIARAVPTLASRNTGEVLSLRHGTLAYILPACKPRMQFWLWNVIKRNEIKVHWHTYLHFATHFISAPELIGWNHFEQGLEALSAARSNGANLDSDAFRSTCTNLLRSAIRQPDGLRVCLRAVDSLVEMGVKLNLALLNVIMLNAVEALDFTTAWSIYHSLPKYGLQPDVYTFAILLKACKANLDDAEMLNETIRNLIAHVDVKALPELAANVLHGLYLHHTKHRPEKTFETLSEAYTQLFDTAPLSELGLLPSHAQSSKEKRKIAPNHSAVGVMLNAYLDQLFLQTQSPVQAHFLYRRFRELVAAGTEPFASMVGEDYIPNAFLVNLTKTKAGLPAATEVIKDMQRYHPADDRRAEQCKPTLRTWTIFLHGFKRHGQMKLAEQVVEYMQRQGTKPDLVVWNILVDGYATAQDSEGVERVLKGLKETGNSWDDLTRKAVEKLKGDKGKDMLGEDEDSELDFTSELRAELKRRIGGDEDEDDTRSYTPMV